MASGNHRRLDAKRWAQVCTSVKDRDGHACVYCQGDRDLQVDHVRPLASLTPEEWDDGTPYDESNLVTACRTCNGRKGARALVRMDWVNTRWLNSL